MKKLLIFFSVAALAFSCNPVEPFEPDPEGVLINPDEKVTGGVAGFYLLNEGQMGQNNATLDFYDYSTGRYISDVFALRNPGETFGLGDTGNDLKIYGDRLYAVINGSNFVVVMDAATAKYVGKVAVPSPRNIAFEGNYAYVTSYASATMDDGNHTGHVSKIDLTTLREVATCPVGYQPDELVVAGGKLYVANSGGYTPPDFDTRVSVIDLATFTQTKTIEVAPNLYRIRPDGNGKLYISSRGDYAMTPEAVYTLDLATEEVAPTSIAGSNITIGGTTAYVISVFYDPDNNWAQTNSYSTYNTTTATAGGSFITDGTDSGIVSPYGLAIHPANGEIVIGDAKTYTGNGVLSCYTAAGVRKWQVSTGVVPGHIAMAGGDR